MRIPRWALAYSVLALASSFIVVACGGERATAPITPPPAIGPSPNLVGDDDIEGRPADSPERAILSWAQAVQFRDARAVIRAYSPRAREGVDDAQIKQAVRDIGQSLGRPDFVRRIEHDSGTSVRAFLVSYSSARTPVLQEPVTFDLVRRDGTWLLDDLTPLLEAAKNVRDAASGSP